jgi:two-component system response regulator CpxR
VATITVFSGTCCHAEDVAREVAHSLDYEIVRDQDLVSETTKRFDMPDSKLVRAMVGKTSVFNKFTHERERCIAYLKCVLADNLRRGNQLYLGASGHLIPRGMPQVIRVCMMASVPYRTKVAMHVAGMSQKEAIRSIHSADVEVTRWTAYLFQKHPWDPSLYDIVVRMDEKTVEQVSILICNRAGTDVVQTGETYLKALEDLYLTAQIEVVLAREGHDVSVSAKDGRVVLTINKRVIMLSRLEEELKRIVGGIPGVLDVETTVGPGFYEKDVYRHYDFRTPSKVLLVDDELHFVRTLSERLLLRNVGTAVVYDGGQALDFLEEEEPDVMILDLKMPGIDGVAVLKRVRESHPNVEVIILTGHGSEAEKEECVAMGAFAYLEKPVDIERLTATLRSAGEKSGELVGGTRHGSEYPG